MEEKPLESLESSRHSGMMARRLFSVLPSVILALLPRLACPCQLPAYVGLMSSLGLSFLLQTVYLFPLTAVCLTFAVGGLAVGARRRQGYAPFGLGLLSATLVMTGKFVLGSSWLVYAAVAALLLASLWNSWPGKQRGKWRFTADGEVERI